MGVMLSKYKYYNIWKGIMSPEIASLKILISMLIIAALVAVPSRSPYQIEENVDKTVDFTQCTSLPKEFREIQDLDQRKRVLIDTLLPLVLKENEEIKSLRAELLRIKKTSFYLTTKEMRFIEDLAGHYKVKGVITAPCSMSSLLGWTSCRRLLCSLRLLLSPDGERHALPSRATISLASAIQGVPV